MHKHNLRPQYPAMYFVFAAMASSALCVVSLIAFKPLVALIFFALMICFAGLFVVNA